LALPIKNTNSPSHIFSGAIFEIIDELIAKIKRRQNAPDDFSSSLKNWYSWHRVRRSTFALKAGKPMIRAQLLYFSGNSPESIANFSQKYQISALDSAISLAGHPDLDLIVIANVNQAHALIARTALKSGKHVIVEYPLAFHPAEAEELITLAETEKKLLHVEHIELLGGLHQTQQQYLASLGNIHLARYTTIAPADQHPGAGHFIGIYSVFL
jgi:predicted dehydrogenase